MAKKQGFSRWDDLQRYQLNGHKPKKLARELVKEAKNFLPEYKFEFCGGIWLCRGDGACDDYVFHFAIAMKQEQIWNYPEYQAGYAFGLNSKEPYRSANPYEERSRRRSWDCGYIYGLYDAEKKPKVKDDTQGRCECG